MKQSSEQRSEVACVITAAVLAIREMASDDDANDETYNKEYRRLKTLTSQTDIVEVSVSFRCLSFLSCSGASANSIGPSRP